MHSQSVVESGASFGACSTTLDLSSPITETTSLDVASLEKMSQDRRETHALTVESLPDDVAAQIAQSEAAPAAIPVSDSFSSSSTDKSRIERSLILVHFVACGCKLLKFSKVSVCVLLVFQRFTNCLI